jgi:hypothetical protein
MAISESTRVYPVVEVVTVTPILAGRRRPHNDGMTGRGEKSQKIRGL